MKNETEVTLTAEHNNPDSGPSHYDGDAILLPGRVEQLEREAKEAKKRDEEYKDEQLRLDRRMVRFTGFLVLTSLISGGISIWQGTVARTSAKAAKSAAETAHETLREVQKSGTDTHQLAESATDQVKQMGRQASDTHELAVQARQQSDTAKRQSAGTELIAKAATIQANEVKSEADTSVQTMHMDERAWVNINVDRGGPMLDKEPLLVPVTISDDGKTTAFNVVGKMMVNILPVGEEPDFVYTEPTHPGYNITVKALPPKLPQHQKWAALPKYLPRENPLVPITYTPDLIKQIEDGSIYIVIYTHLTYDDIFGVHHWLNFCIRMQNATPGVQSKSAGRACGDYNDADRNF